MPTRKQINQRLREEIEQCRVQYDDSTKRFIEVFSSTPSGLPHPDGVKRIELIAQERRLAMKKLAGAVRDLSEYLIRGTEPKPEGDD